VPVNDLVDLLLATSRSEPDRHLLRSSTGEIWSYGDLSTRSAQLGHALQSRGIQAGDRIMVQLEKSPDVLALHVAILRIGAVYIPLNTAYTVTELQALVDDAEPVLLVCEAPLELSCPQISLMALNHESRLMSASINDVERSINDPAAMLYTSGTTGRPKGVVLSQGNLLSAITTLTEAWDFTRADVLLHALPLFHTHGLFVAAYCTITTGGSMILLDQFSPSVVMKELPNASVFMGVPTFYTRLLAEPSFTRAITDHMRLFTSGSAPMVLSTHIEFESRTGVTILERYGMTETCMLTSNPLVGTRKPGTVGLPLSGVDLRIVDGSPGSIEVRGPNVFSGYWQRPELRDSEFTADGWFKTGDIGQIDEDGYVEIVGRSKDLVITGGLNVYPKEVEQALDALPCVLESAVFGLADADFGEAVTAAVVLTPGATVDPDELRQQARQVLAAFKVPKRIHIVSALPRNAMGKVEKARLRTEYLHSPID
jgi:malonyl-CoA/methylmalonyl-CoA synthetase